MSSATLNLTIPLPAGARLWNSIPAQLSNPVITYRLQMKGHLFREARTRHSVNLIRGAPAP